MKNTDLQRLNDLIDWYAANTPNVARHIHANKTPEQLHKMLGIAPKVNAGKEVFERELPYRGHLILAREAP